MQTTEKKLNDISEIIVGLPTQRYTEAEDVVTKKILDNKSIEEIDTHFEYTEANISSSIGEQFYSQENDILYKVQQQSFAKQITTEIGVVIPNTYIIIRVNDTSVVNPNFLTYYLNDPRVAYEIQRQIDSTKIMKVSTSILKELTIKLPDMEVQNNYAELINKVYERIELKRKSIECDMDLVNSLYDEVIGDMYERKV